MPTSRRSTSVAMAPRNTDTGVGQYTLDPDHNPVPATHEEWARIMEDQEARRVARDEVMVGNSKVTVSTVFLGIDHGWADTIELFETMTFGDPYDQQLIGRYATWDEAERGHVAVVRRLLKGYSPTLYYEPRRG